MKAYWDASALIASLSDSNLRQRLRAERAYTRTHVLSEVFSAITGGNLSIRVTADRAAELLRQLSADLDYLDLTAQEVLDALNDARARGVRGGRVHDFLHAKAAEKSGATELLTTDRNDFQQLSNSLTITQV